MVTGRTTDTGACLIQAFKDELELTNSCTGAWGGSGGGAFPRPGPSAYLITLVTEGSLEMDRESEI